MTKSEAVKILKEKVEEQAKCTTGGKEKLLKSLYYVDCIKYDLARMIDDEFNMKEEEQMISEIFS